MSEDDSAQRDSAMIVSGFAHEMKSCISGAHYALDVLISRNDGSLTAAIGDQQRLKDCLLIVRDGLDNAQKIVHQALQFASLGHIAPADERVEVGKLLDKLRAEFNESFTAHKIACDVVVPDSFRLAMKEDHVYAVLRNFLANARDAIATRDEVSPGQITVRAEVSEGSMAVVVEDNGVGIPEGVRADVFKPFFTTKGHNGTGVGLGFCRQIVGLYGGEITFERRQPHGTMFKMTVKRGNI